MSKLLFNKNEDSQKNFKRVCLILTCSLLMVNLFGCSNSEQTSNETLKLTSEIETLKASNDELSAEVSKLETENNELVTTNSELQQKVDLAKPWFEMSEMEQKSKEEEIRKQKEAEELAAKEKEEAERLAKEEEEEAQRLAKEEEERKGYDTGITYDQLARTPDDYMLEKVKFSGEVIQVMEGDGETQLRIAVNSDYDQIIYVSYDSGIISSRVLDGDYITIMGLSFGLLSYESTMGGTITIPSVLVEKIEF